MSAKPVKPGGGTGPVQIGSGSADPKPLKANVQFVGAGGGGPPPGPTSSQPILIIVT